MARNKYQHEKRMKDLAKKKKREEKMQRKLERKGLLPPPGDDSVKDDADSSADPDCAE
ncbi:MAG: hypothetical protein AMXMBFR4_12470 [Candidatus Hydrogenedentota bacterium]